MRTEQIELFQEYPFGYGEKEAVTDTIKIPETVEENPKVDVIIEEPVSNYFTSAHEICKTDYPDEPMLIQDLLPNGVIGVCVASSDVGKSMFWRQACACVAMKKDSFIGKKLNIKYGRAAYVSTEDNERVFNTQYNKWNLNEEELLLLKNLHVKVETKKFPNKDFFSQAIKTPYDLIVVDVLSDVIQDDLNDARRTREYYNQFKTITNQFGTTILFIHHINKAGDKQGSFSKGHVLGSSAIESASRSLIFISKDGNDNTVRNISVLKCNSLPELKKNKPFKIRFTEKLWFDVVAEERSGALSTANLEEVLSKQVLDLHNRGLSHRNISKQLSEEGFTICKTKVGDIINKEAKQSQLEKIVEQV